MKAAAAAWEIRPCRHEDDFWSHLMSFVAEAARAGCELLVLPELITLELEGMFEDSSLRPQERSPLLASSFASLQREVDRLGLTVVAGSAFERLSHGWVNRSPILRPHRPIEWQDKRVLTQFEAVEWGLAAGTEARAKDGLGVLICYDSEFPPLAMSLGEEGLNILAVPTFTETWHGHHRVRYSCQARALELQAYVLQAPLIGSLGREPVPSAHGAAAIFAPPVEPFPADGILAELPRDEEGLAIADLDLEAILACRTQGDVRNWNDRAQAWGQGPSVQP